MGLELDTLRNNGDMVIYNNTNGAITPFYDKEHLRTQVKKMGFEAPELIFEDEEIEEFISRWSE